MEQEKSTGELNIEKGFWYGAGSPKLFNWSKDGYHQYGVGIDTSLLVIHDQLKIKVENQNYLLDTKTARDFISRYDSIKMRKGVRLGIVSKTLLTKI